MANGQVDVRHTKNGRSRLRFYAVADDQLEVILLALKVARSWANTEYDGVALDAICQHFLTSGVAGSIAKSATGIDSPGVAGGSALDK